MPKWPRRWSAKPVLAGSSPAATSKKKGPDYISAWPSLFPRSRVNDPLQQSATDKVEATIKAILEGGTRLQVSYVKKRPDDSAAPQFRTT